MRFCMQQKLMVGFVLAFLIHSAARGNEDEQSDGSFPIIYEGVTYDIRSLFEPLNGSSGLVRHPGGAETLRPYRGKDITAILNGFHKNHRYLLNKCPVLSGEPSTTNKVCDLARLRPKLGLIRSAGISEEQAKLIHERFKAWVLAEGEMPCILARTALRRENYGMFISDKPLGTREAALDHLAALSILKQAQSAAWAQGEFMTPLLAFYPNTQAKDNDEFEDLLFKHLQHSLDLDPEELARRPGCEGETLDANSPSFDFAALKRRFFIAALSPIADRKARRFDTFGMVMNASTQFDWLRDTQQMSAIAKAVRRRDKIISGSINPNIEFHEEDDAEGRQYAGVDHHLDRTFHVPLDVRSLEARQLEALTYDDLQQIAEAMVVVKLDE